MKVRIFKFKAKRLFAFFCLITLAFSVVSVVFDGGALRTPFASAHESDAEHNDGEEDSSLFDDAQVRKVSTQLAIWAGVVLLILVIVALLVYDPQEGAKKTLFVLMTLAAVVPTVFFIASTIYINVVSETGGPVHWHADFRVFACGEEFSPPEPEGISNKVGNAVLHEHEDRRIHVEGVVSRNEDVSLKSFFAVKGGELEDSYFTVPTDKGLETFSNGEKCPDGRAGTWQVFVYKTEDGAARQGKVLDYKNYILSPHQLVPPGDCIIFEFAPLKEKTEYICDFYQLEINEGNLRLE